MKKIIQTENAPKPVGAYSQAVFHDNMLFISGQVPVNPASNKVETTDIKAQTKQVMNNVGAILEKAGLDFNHVIKASIFITDMDNFGKVNEVYSTFFKSDFPARECVQVSKLPLGVDVEISVIAAK